MLLHEKTCFFSLQTTLHVFPTTQGNNLDRGILALGRLLKIINFNQAKIYEKDPHANINELKSKFHDLVSKCSESFSTRLPKRNYRVASAYMVALFLCFS